MCAASSVTDVDEHSNVTTQGNLCLQANNRCRSTSISISIKLCITQAAEILQVSCENISTKASFFFLLLVTTGPYNLTELLYTSYVTHSMASYKHMQCIHQHYAAK